MFTRYQCKCGRTDLTVEQVQPDFTDRGNGILVMLEPCEACMTDAEKEFKESIREKVEAAACLLKELETEVQK